MIGTFFFFSFRACACAFVRVDVFIIHDDDRGPEEEEGWRIRGEVEGREEGSSCRTAWVKVGRG